MISKRELKIFAGEKTFQQGEALFRDDHVQLQVCSETQITGLVSDTYDYRVSVTGSKLPYHFSCDCAAFEYQEVCNHCVALVLAYHDSHDAVENNDTAQSALPEDQNLVIEQYLKDLPADKLRQYLMELICEDRHHYEKWLTKAEMASGQHNFQPLSKLIIKALPLRNIWDFREVADYFDNAQQAITDVLNSSEKLDAAEQLQLILAIYEHLESVMEHIDDPHGHRDDVQHQLASALSKAIRRQSWTTEQKALWLDDALAIKYEGFPAIPASFDLDQAELQTFVDVCQRHFEQTRISVDIALRQYDHLLTQRGQILLKYLPRAQEFDTALNIKAKMVHGFFDSLDLSQFCLEHSDGLAAEEWLLRAKSLIPAPEDQLSSKISWQNSWDNQAIKVYAALGEPRTAWNIAWQIFQAIPNFTAWQTLKENIKTIGWHPDNLKKDVESLLIANSQNDDRSRFWSDHDHIVYFYLSEQCYDKAIFWIDNHEIGNNALSTASHKLAQTFPKKAIEYAERACSLLLRFADNSNYHESVTLLKKLEDGLPDESATIRQFEQLIKSIAAENRRRPNMIELLTAQFKHYL